MALIDISNLSFTYEGSYDAVFSGVSVQLDTDWRLGFIGRNGRGKTTLLRLLMGQMEHTGRLSSPVQCDYFPMGVPDASLPAGVIGKALRPAAEHWQLVREMNLLQLDEGMLARPFATLSHGEQTRFLLALLFLQETHFLLIDEPTNHLDAVGRRLVGDYLAKKRGFMLVSHDRDFLDHCVDHVLVFNRTGLEVQRGNFSSWWKNKEMRDQFELAEREKLQKDVKRLGEAARRTAGWSDTLEATKNGTRNSGLRPDRGFIGHKSAKLMQRAQATERRRAAALEEKSKLLQDYESAEQLKLSPLEHPQLRLVEAADLTIAYGGAPVCMGVSFIIERGERVALCGCNGAGKSSILKLICGEHVPHTGVLTLASGLILSVVPQEASWLCGALADFARASGVDESLFMTVLRKLDFERVQLGKDMAEYSGGQKKKVLLARSLCQRAQLYLWDEPLNFVDVYARMQLETLLLAFHPTMLFIEHDAAFVGRVATKRLLL